jgi:hypothetical protein
MAVALADRMVATMILTAAQFAALPSWAQLLLLSVGDASIVVRGWGVA